MGTLYDGIIHMVFMRCVVSIAVAPYTRLGQRPQSSSASRFTAGAFGFLTFTQCAAADKQKAPAEASLGLR